MYLMAGASRVFSGTFEGLLTVVDPDSTSEAGQLVDAKALMVTISWKNGQPPTLSANNLRWDKMRGGWAVSE
jgi:hypothetical protein